MLSRLTRYFRAGHVSMAPGLKLSILIDAIRMQQHSKLPFPWQIPAVCESTNTSSPDLTNTSPYGIDTFNGSAAIAAMVADMELDSKDSVLLPAYCCGAELGPFRHAKCKIHFYDVNPDLSINRTQVERLVAEHPEIRLLFITHYFGIAQADMASIAQWCKDQNIVLVEDCAHALYSKDGDHLLGGDGDYAVFSPRKSMPITEGGRLVSRKALKKSTVDSMTRPPPLLPRWERLCYSLQQGARSRPLSLSLHGLGSISIIALTIMPSVVIKIARAIGNFHQDHWLTPEVEGEDAVPIYHVGISALSHKILSVGNVQTITATRKANYAYWQKSIQASDQLQPLIPLLPEGSCPLYFPVVVSNPAMCVEALAQSDIEAFNWWQYMPEELLAEDQHSYPVACKLKQSVVALPLHQFVTHSQIDRMANVLIAAASE